MNNNDINEENEIKAKKYGVLENIKLGYYVSENLYIAKFKFPKKLHKDDYYTIAYIDGLGTYRDIFYHNYYDYGEIEIVLPIEKCKEYIECDKDLVKTFCKLNKINPNKKIIIFEESGNLMPIFVRKLDIYIVKKDNKTNIFISSYPKIKYDRDKSKFTENNYLKDILTGKEYINVKILAKIPLIAYLKGYPKLVISKKDIKNAFEQFISEYNSKSLVDYEKFKEIAGSNNNEDENKNEMDEIEEKQKEEERINSEREELINSILTSINSLNESVQRLEKLNNPNNNIMKDIYHSIKVDENLLFENVNGHFEVRSEFIPVLKFIDLSLTSPSNLKLSGIDWSETNLASYNPQLAYNKDLSFAKFNDSNLFGDFTNCDLRGTYLKDEKWLIGIEDAITDENTVLPDNDIKSNTL